MNGLLLTAAVVLTAALAVEGLLARHELLFSVAGWRPTLMPAPPARVAAPTASDAEPPPTAWLVYFDGIGKTALRDSRDGGRLLASLAAADPRLRIVGTVLPYSPGNRPATDARFWAWARRHARPLLFLHNAMQTLTAADRRYRPLYSDAVADHTAYALTAAGYQPGSRTPVVLLAYSGGAQVASSLLARLTHQLACPTILITLGGFHDGGSDLTNAAAVHQLTSPDDIIERLADVLFWRRWPLAPRSPWQHARRTGTLHTHQLPGAHHFGPHGYLSTSGHTPDGLTQLQRTTNTITALLAGPAPSPHPSHPQAEAEVDGVRTAPRSAELTGAEPAAPAHN